MTVDALRRRERGIVAAATGVGKSVVEIELLRLLRRHLCLSSLADLEAIVELYPDHVIELGAYSCNVGVIPWRNAVIWEVRRY